MNKNEEPGSYWIVRCTLLALTTAAILCPRTGAAQVPARIEVHPLQTMTPTDQQMTNWRIEWNRYYS